LAYPSHIPGELDHLLYKVPMLSKGNLQAKQQEKYKHNEKFTEMLSNKDIPWMEMYCTKKVVLFS
jgi:hypothetical protein